MSARGSEASGRTDSADSSNDEDQLRKARKHTYAVRRVSYAPAKRLEATASTHECVQEQAEEMRTEVSHLADQLKVLKRQRKEQQDAADSRANGYAMALNANTYMRSLIQMQQQTLLSAHSALSDWMVRRFSLRWERVGGQPALDTP